MTEPRPLPGNFESNILRLLNVEYLEDNPELAVDPNDLAAELVFFRGEGFPAHVVIQEIENILINNAFTEPIIHSVRSTLIAKEAELQIFETMKTYIGKHIREAVVSGYRMLIPQIEHGVISFDQAITSITSSFMEILEADIKEEVVIEILIEEGLLD